MGTSYHERGPAVRRRREDAVPALYSLPPRGLRSAWPPIDTGKETPMLRRLGPLAALLLLAGCDPHDTRVTDKNKDSLFEELRQSPKISYDEKALLAAL